MKSLPGCQFIHWLATAADDWAVDFPAHFFFFLSSHTLHRRSREQNGIHITVLSHTFPYTHTHMHSYSVKAGWTMGIEKLCVHVPHTVRHFLWFYLHAIFRCSTLWVFSLSCIGLYLSPFSLSLSLCVSWFLNFSLCLSILLSQCASSNLQAPFITAKQYINGYICCGLKL